MSKEIETLAEDLLDTKEKISNFNQRFDKLEVSQSGHANAQSLRFDRLERLIANMSVQPRPKSPSQPASLTHPEVYLTTPSYSRHPTGQPLPLRQESCMLSQPEDPLSPWGIQMQEDMDHGSSQYD